MKILIALLLVSLPAAVRACGMSGGCGQCHGGWIHAASALYAVLAALGYWVLQHSGKEAANLARRTGAVLGMALVVIGLLGVLCGVGNHIRKRMPRSCCGQGALMRCGMEGKISQMPEMRETGAAPGAEKSRSR